MSDQDPSIGPTYRHGDAKPFEFAMGDSENIEAISAHIERWIGKPDSVFHELISDKVHIDVHMVAPSEKFPWHTLVTSGMSDRPMRAPEEHPEWSYAELFICLPPDWKLEGEDAKEERYFWPIHALKFLARFPHQHDTWLWYGHTIPNGDPPAPFNAFTRMCGFILLPPHCVPAGFHELKIDAEKTIRFFALVPMYAEELQLKLRRGAEAFEDALIAAGYSELLQPNRKSVVAPEQSLFTRFFNKLTGR
jgi:hypothetical protein